MNSNLGLSDPLSEAFYSSKLQSIRDKHSKMIGESSSTNSDSRKAQIEDLLRCIICFNKVKNPQMCPSCSKLSCNNCIRKWLTEQKSQCPHCRCHLRASQLVNCRFVSEIATAIDQIQTKKADEEEVCSQHHAKLSYYCKTCETPICADCAMFGAEHKNHEFEHITKIYDSHVELIRSEAQGLKKRLKDLANHLSLLESTIEKVTRCKEEKAAELGIVLEQMSQKLDAELKSKLLALLAQKGSITDEIEFLESMQGDLNRQLLQSPKSVLIASSMELIRMLKDVNAKAMPKFTKNSVTAEFKSEIVPQFDSAIFHMKNFSVLRETTEVIYSEPFQANGLTWRLKVYPNGNGVAKGVYLSVFLEMVKGLQDSSKYEYKVEMINQRNPDVVVLREFASEFETGECWGYNRFFKIDMLEKDGYLLPDDDTIVLKYFVRAPSYFQQCQDQKKYIQYLEKLKNQSSSTVAELKDKLKKEIEKNRKLTEVNPSLMSTVRNSASPERIEERNDLDDAIPSNSKTSKKKNYETNIETLPQEEDNEINDERDDEEFQVEDGEEEGTERAYEEEPEEEEEKQIDLEQEEFLATGREEEEEEDVVEEDSRTTEKMMNMKEAESSKKTQSKEIRRTSSPLLEEHKFSDFENDENENDNNVDLSSGKIDEFLKKNKEILSSNEKEDMEFEKKDSSMIGDILNNEDEENHEVPNLEEEDSKIDSIIQTEENEEEESPSLDELCEKVHSDMEEFNSLQPISLENIFNIKGGQVANSNPRRNLFPTFEAEKTNNDSGLNERAYNTSKSLQLPDSLMKKLTNLNNYSSKDRNNYERYERRRYTPTPTAMFGHKTERVSENDKENLSMTAKPDLGLGLRDHLYQNKKD